MSDLPSEPWLHADLFFLTAALQKGMALEKVAGFLGRTVGEVQAKAEELRLPVNGSRP
jgi:hypothetical protein